ncbi:OLC1v1001976C1 [Oldenlandia corymbosa var. corymbosa]|uniref:OLC1v1001976C1 n=1 Tax=Oldenlandia corymbosa var. corymbosa TaxID=529605 RepID=A0AAV1D8U8_OLDCO|nr:OLC1v1001976C1 [Oldenlandia corymbosa var. corymbosa]
MELHRKEVEESVPPETIGAKFCADCRTTKTPLWRGGPSGPKSLCNACGIRHRKRRAANGTVKSTTSSSSTSTETSTGVGLKKEEGEMVKKEGENTSSKSKKRAKVKNGNKYDKLSVEWRQRLMAFGEGVVLFQKQRSQLKKKQRIDGEKGWGEVEEAAVLLMSLSYGSVFA